MISWETFNVRDSSESLFFTDVNKLSYKESTSVSTLEKRKEKTSGDVVVFEYFQR